MANQDYIQGGIGSFTPNITVDTIIFEDTTVFTFTEFNFPRPAAVEVGMAGLIGEEIVQVVEVGVMQFTVKRGCADTIPARYGADMLCWFFAQSTGSDRREYDAGQTIGIKVSPFTTGGGEVPKEFVPPLALTFNWRFLRPYPPAQMRANGERWYAPAAISATSNLHLTWVHRDRILQADQLLGQDEPTIGPEPGATYTLRVYDAEGALLRTEAGIRGNTFDYQWPQAVHDFGVVAGTVDGSVQFTSTRALLDSWQHYEIAFTLDPAGTLTSNYLAFDQVAMESPYMVNVLRAPIFDNSYTLAVAARPADRMVDTYALLGASLVDSGDFTPWVTSDFRLPELETILNIRNASTFDGVPVTAASAGELAMIDNELVQIVDVTDSQVRIARGVGDTVPQVHLPGAKLWLLESASTFDLAAHTDGQVQDYKLSPNVYGPPIDPATLPTNTVTAARRSERPYAPGQLVVAGRPWFEEAQALSGQATRFSWARRNRITQGAIAYDHAQSDELPELGQVTRLVFFYETPPAAPGDAPVRHVLRTVTSATVFYDYPYALAQADGNTAGTALGICGSVVISVEIAAVRSDLASWQMYIAPLRVPSFPCAA